MSTVNGIPIEELCGYAGAVDPSLVREAHKQFGDAFHTFKISGSTGEDQPARVMLFDFNRQVLKDDLINISQEIGDCVSWGMRNATCYIQFLPMVNGRRAIFHDTFAPYFYGISRQQIGGNRIWGDGSVGAWAAAGVLKYGVLAVDEPGVPKYSGSVAKAWGKSGPPENFITVGQKYLVKSAAKVSTVDQAVEAIKNGYAVTVASNYGFRMEAGASGFHEASGTWNHQMCLIGVDTGDSKVPFHFCLRNSWGDAHGVVKDFRNPDVTWPKGTLRVRPEVIGKMLAQDDSFSPSLFDGFPAQPIPRDLCDPW